MKIIKRLVVIIAVVFLGLGIPNQIKAAEVKEVKVNNTKDFINSIASNTKIILKPGTYNLSALDIKLIKNKNVNLEDVFDGKQFVIKGVTNCSIVSEANKAAEILVRPRYAFVLTFKDSIKITTNGLILGHTVEQGSCTGGVLAFNKCNSININNCELFGCGTEGVNLESTNNFTFSNSQIRECTYGIMTISNSKNVNFIKSKFNDNKEFDLINISNNSNVVFDTCKIIFNHTDNEGYCDFALFNLDKSASVLVKNSIITDNMVHLFQRPDTNIIFKNTKIENNGY